MRSSFLVLPRRLRRRAATFGRAREGVTAIEFAMVAPVFFALLLAIFETAFTLLSNQMLETAAADASRLVMTGQAQHQEFDKAAFKTQVCNRLPSFMDCGGKMWVDTRVLGTFDQNVDIPRKGGNGIDRNDLDTDPDNFDYTPGAADEIVMVRLYYKWSGLIASVMSGFGLNLSNQSDGSNLMVATMVFRNEPYQ